MSTFLPAKMDTRSGFIDDKLESEALTGSVSTQMTGSPFSSMHCASSRAATVLPTPPFPCSTKCSLRTMSVFSEEPLAVVRPFERIVTEGSGRVLSGMIGSF